jgi:Activator of Hsp90 ATPase homolog 1-like protein
VSSLKIAPVRKSIVVQATAQKAFDVFTAGIDRWWPKSHGLGEGRLMASFIEPFVGGRWFSRYADGAEAVVGHVLVWEPAQRFVCSWEINAEWKSDARGVFASEVEVRFVPEGPATTRVELEHRNFERMAAPGGENMRNQVDRGWPTIMQLFADEMSREGGSI